MNFTLNEPPQFKLAQMNYAKLREERSLLTTGDFFWNTLWARTGGNRAVFSSGKVCVCSTGVLFFKVRVTGLPVYSVKQYPKLE